MRIAIVGTGIAGMVAAHLLARRHDIVVFEANASMGGHTRTVPVVIDGETQAVDTGFVVYSEEAYPNFARLIRRLGVATQATEMSFSVRCPASGFEYGGPSLAALFAQPRNLVRPGFHRMLVDVLRFGREAPALLGKDDDDPTIGDYLATHGYSGEFRDWYLVPMASAIWSARPADVPAMPARYLVAFFRHHGLLRRSQRLRWRTITGGAQRYVDALTASYRDRVRLACTVTSVRRHRDHVLVATRGAEPERVDHVVLAVHGSQALRLLADPTPEERQVLGAFTEQENESILHTDPSLLPANRRARASWNVRLDPHGDRVSVTYDMARLQRLRSALPICVSLNAAAAIAPQRILRRITYHHPVYTRAAVAAQRRHATINGVDRTYYCGAYWGYGFHEDGVDSALAACRPFGASLET
jgi:predicted NAD/FAD-binding protein